MRVQPVLVRSQFLPATTVEVDVPARWIIRLEIADRPVARFGGVRAYVPPGWTMPQLKNPGREGYVEVAPRTAARLRTFLHVGRWITVEVVEGLLLPGDVIDIHYGGAAGARPPRVSDEVTEFTILVDYDGFGNYDRQPGSPVVRTIPGRPVGLEVATPQIVSPGEAFPLLVKAVDVLGNTVPLALGLEVMLASSAQGPGIRALGPQSEGRASLTNHVESHSATVSHRPTVPSAGTWWVHVYDREKGLEGRSPAISAEPSASLRLYWGDIHGHSSTSDGALSPEEYYAFARDDSGLDFCALTDHDDVGHNSNVPEHSKFMTQGVWEELQAVTNRFNVPGRFVTLIGYEYSQIELGVEGHRNVYYKADSGPLLHVRDPRCNTPTRLFRELADIDALVIPHHPLHFMGWEHDPRVQRLVEVYSMWGSSEDTGGDCAFTGKMVSAGSGISFQAYLARGYRLGVTAGGDNHDSRPGRRGATDRWRKGRMAQPPGLLAIYAPELTRGHVFDALWKRQCYGTTGQRILLEFRLNGHIMGDEITVPSPSIPRRVSLRVLGEGPLAAVEIIRDNAVVATWVPDGETFAIEWEDPTPVIGGTAFYYARVRQADGGRAWSSPIWVDVVGEAL